MCSRLSIRWRSTRGIPSCAGKTREREIGSWYSVIYDAEERIFKTWYGGDTGTFHETEGQKSPGTSVCYATSHDGMHWERPNIGRYEIMGTKDNNVVLDPAYHDGMGHWESVVKDPMGADSGKRYKALGWSSYDWKGPLSGIYTMTSPDGLHWNTIDEPIIHFHPRPGTADLGPIGDAQALMIDTLQHRYAALLRASPDRKMSVSKDFVTWSAPQVCMKAREGEDNNTLYNHLGFVYGDQYLGVPKLLCARPRESPGDGSPDLQPGWRKLGQTQSGKAAHPRG